MAKDTLAERQIKSIAETKRPTRVLIVENDKPVREGLARALTLESYEVTTAANGLEAIERDLDQFPVDALLLDLDLSDQHRWQAVRRLAAANPLLSVIGMTARPARNAEAVAADLEAVVEKPFEFSTLLRLLDVAPAGSALS